MKKKILIVSIICTIPIGLFIFSQVSENNDFKNFTNKESFENNKKDSFSLYNANVKAYSNSPNLIGNTQTSNLKFSLNENKLVNGYKEIEDFDMALLDNITDFKDIENILKEEPNLEYREYFIDIELDKTISNPNIVLSRAKYIGKLAARYDYGLEETYQYKEEYMTNYVGAIAKLDGIGLNLNDKVKFKLLNYLIDNIENIKNLDSMEEIFEYTYILNTVYLGFINAPPNTYSYLTNIESLLEYRIRVAIDEEIMVLDESLVKNTLKRIEKSLEELKTYK